MADAKLAKGTYPPQAWRDILKLIDSYKRHFNCLAQTWPGVSRSTYDILNVEQCILNIVKILFDDLDEFIKDFAFTYILIGLRDEEEENADSKKKL